MYKISIKNEEIVNIGKIIHLINESFENTIVNQKKYISIQKI